MLVFGEHGEVDTVDCAVDGEPFVVVSMGDLVDRYDSEYFKTDMVGPPANCPRMANFDETKKLGCLGCAKARVYYIDGEHLIEPLSDVSVTDWSLSSNS